MKTSNTLKKRIFGSLLSACMVLSVLPLTPLSASAAEVDSCAEDGCGGTYDSNGFCSTDSTHCEAAEVVSDTHHAELNSTHSGYYAIENAGQLYWFAELVNSGTVGSVQGTMWKSSINAVLTDDIVVNQNVLSDSGEPNDGTYIDWTPIGIGTNADGKTVYYSGTFDGNDKTVSGLYLDGYATSSSTGKSKVGLFATNYVGTIKNVTVSDSYFGGYDWVGGIIGYFMSGTMENCVNKATVKGYQNIGGVSAGSNNAVTYINCRNDGLVMGSNYTGGFAGQIKGNSKITNCANTGTVKWISGSYGRMGGFVASTVYGSSSSVAPTYTNCYNTGAVIYTAANSFSNEVGGFAGNANCSTFTNCYSSGSITVDEQYNASSTKYRVGGFVGSVGNSTYTSFTNCYYNNENIKISYESGSPSTSPTGCSSDSFKSGEITYKLNGSTSDGDLVWGQTIGTDDNPNFTGKTVYYDESATPQYYNEKPTTFTVAFDANGGTGEMTAVPEISGDYTLPECTFTAPDGKQFAGWATATDGEVITTDTIAVTTNTTLYALWVDIANESAITRYASTLSYEDMIYVIDIFEFTDVEDVDLTKDAGILIWSEEEYAALEEVAFDADHAKVGLQSYTGAENCYYSVSDGIYTRYLSENNYYVGYVKLSDGTYNYSEPKLYGPEIYAYNMLSKDTTADTTKALCVALLNYISAAQKYFYPETAETDLVNYDLTDDQKALDWSNVSLNLAPEIPKDMQVERDSEVFTATAKNLLFEEMISLGAVYSIDHSVVENATESGTIFWTAEEFAALESAPSLDNYGGGTNVKMTQYRQTDGMWVSNAPKIAAKDMADTQYYYMGYVKDSEGNVSYSGVMSYTIEQYISNKADSDTMGEFAKRLYFYERAAEAALKTE